MPRPKTLTPAHPRPKRARRTEEVLIAALQEKIAKLEARKLRKAAKADPVAKLATKLVRQLRKAESTFVDGKRLDLANSAKAAAIAIERVAITVAQSIGG